VIRRFLFIGFLAALGGASPAKASSVTAEILRLSGAYGATAWDSVESLHYAFHVTKGTTTVTRLWEWDVKTGQVTVETDEGGARARITYERNALDQGDRAQNEKADRWFINDQYWLLFPLHLTWDNDAEISLGGEENLPMSRGRAAKMTVVYPAAGDGYTPGDAYDIFYGPVKGKDERLRAPAESARWQDSPYIFRQWIFRKGGAAKPTLVTTWAGYQRLGPLIVATEHRDKSGRFHLWFSDLSIKLVDDAAWKRAGPVDVPKP
jgi:hypothetical protein